MSDFFEDPNTQIKDEQPTTDKINLDGAEYTQDELKKLVGLGKIGLEAEEKFKTPIDKVWPNYQRVINENQEFKKQQEESRQREIDQKVNQGQQLSAEEQREQARKAARDLGLVTREEIEQISREEYVKNSQIGKLLDQTGAAIEKFKNDYNISTQVDDVLRHMDENGFKNPEKAMKDMFEDKIDQIKEQRLKSIKPQGMTTNDGSQAGGKQPAPQGTARNEEDLLKQLHEAIQNG